MREDHGTGSGPDDETHHGVADAAPGETIGMALNRLVCQVHRRLHERCAAAARSHNVLPNEIEVITTLGVRGGMRMSDLAQALAVAPPSATRIAKRLEARQLISRQRSTHSDREVIVGLTDEGKQLFDSCNADLGESRERFFDQRLDSTEKRLLMGLLERLNASNGAPGAESE